MRGGTDRRGDHITMSEHSTSQPTRAHDLRHLGALTMRSTRDGDAHVIALSGELDLAGAGLLEDELLRVEASDAAQIVIDLRELEFIDSTGVRLVYMADARARHNDARLTIRRGHSRVHRIFELTDLADRLPFVD
jgi:anti-anti-sigma factor